MSFAMSATTLTLGLSTIFGGVAYAVNIYDPVRSYTYSSLEGERYLRTIGYRAIKGGDKLAGHTGCGRNVFARAYEAEKDGVQEKDVVVCFSKIFWAHSPRPEQG